MRWKEPLVLSGESMARPSVSRRRRRMGLPPPTSARLLAAALLAIGCIVWAAQNAQNDAMQQYRADHAITAQQARDMGWEVDA